MKKVVVLLLIATLLLTACVAATEKQPEDQHTKYGKRALEIADNYIDFVMNAGTALARMQDLTNAKGTLPIVDSSNENYQRYSAIENAVSDLYDEIEEAYIQNDAVGVVEARNKLAEVLGEKVR